MRTKTPPAPGSWPVDSYRQLADVFHELLAEQSLEALLERIASALADLVPYSDLSVYEVDEANRCLVPILARSEWAEEILRNRPQFGEGLTGWAVAHLEPVLANNAHEDPRVAQVPGTPVEPEALIVVPLVARDSLKGTLNIYRHGEDAAFDSAEFELAKRFGDAAALAIDNAQIRAALEYQAQTDSLTGLYNHRHFHERLKAELSRASRARDAVALLMIDLDDFKRVNDLYGHGAGDHALFGFADLLRTSVRDHDVACRIGGEEFGVILPSSTAVDAARLGQRLMRLIAEAKLSPDGRISISVGIAEGPTDAMNARDLAASAEAAMMTAKARGGDRVVAFRSGSAERPNGPRGGRDARSIAHLKMLQSVATKLNRLNDVRAIGAAIVTELRALVDYHNCRVVVVDGDDLRPIAFRGELGNPELGPEAVGCRVGEGITGRAAATGESQLVANVRECDFAARVPGTPEIDETIAAVPLRYDTRVIGVIVVSKLGTGQLDADDVRLLEVLAAHASVALENARLYEQQRLAAESASESALIASSLLAFSRELATGAGVDEIARRIASAATRLLGASGTSLWMQADDGGAVRPLAVDGGPLERETRVAGIEVDDQVARPLLTRPSPFELTVEELAALNLSAAPEPANSYFVAPLALDGRLGALVAVLDESAAREERSRVLRLLAGLADQAALALASARNWEGLERMFVSTVEVLANALEANDEDTSSHARWISDAALAVGRRLGLDGAQLRRLEYGALFHDIGQIGIPHDVLLKPGALTREERALVERHPEIGARILAPVERLGDVARIVRACHERWDGTGYPDGLAGEEIPVEARIIFACDAFNAMVTDRPYRSRLPVSEARRRLREGAGSQFDPRVVDVLLELGLEPAVDAEAA
ncbi:MAG: diguanylate cyclase [Thermoleophilia bacterium]|nr:diguanylate cyclase [Thermoleophilia bacterium]